MGVCLFHPQTPTTTPLYRRVAKNPHITLAGLCPWRLPPCGAASHGQNSCLCDEGRAVGTFFVGSAPIPSPTGSVWGLRVRCLSLAPSVLLPDVWSWWLDRARLSGSAFSFSVAVWLGTSPRLVGELLLLSGRVDRPVGTAVRRPKGRARCPPFYGPVHRFLNEQT